MKKIQNEKIIKPVHVHINPKIVSNACVTYASYKVMYFLYHDTGKARRPRRPADPQKEFSACKFTGACFSSLLRAANNKLYGENLNRVCYKIEWPLDDSKYAYTTLSIDEKKAWVALCKTYKLLPGYVTTDVVKDGILVLKLTDTLSPSLLYIYLSAFRCLREQTGFVKALLYLVQEVKMNFYAAFVLASRVTVCGSGGVHHIGTWCRTYIAADDHINAVKIQARDIVAFKRYITNPRSFDPRSIFGSKNFDWECKTRILSAAKGDAKLYSAQELLNPDVIQLLGL